MLAPGTIANGAAQRVLEQTRTSSRRRGGLARRFLTQFELLATPVDGIGGRVGLEVERFSSTIRRMVKGLYRREFGAPLSEGDNVLVYIDPEPSLTRTDLYATVAAGYDHVLGERVLSYRFGRSHDGTRSAWIVRFYDAAEAFVVTLPQD